MECRRRFRRGWFLSPGSLLVCKKNHSTGWRMCFSGSGSSKPDCRGIFEWNMCRASSGRIFIISYRSDRDDASGGKFTSDLGWQWGKWKDISTVCWFYFFRRALSGSKIDRRTEESSETGSGRSGAACDRRTAGGRFGKCQNRYGNPHRNTRNVLFYDRRCRGKNRRKKCNRKRGSNVYIERTTSVGRRERSVSVYRESPVGRIRWRSGCSFWRSSVFGGCGAWIFPEWKTISITRCFQTSGPAGKRMGCYWGGSQAGYRADPGSRGK